MASDHAATHDHDDHAGHDPAEIDKHVRVYIMVFVALMVLTIVTVAISRFAPFRADGRDRGAVRRDRQGSVWWRATSCT